MPFVFLNHVEYLPCGQGFTAAEGTEVDEQEQGRGIGCGSLPPSSKPYGNAKKFLQFKDALTYLPLPVCAEAALYGSSVDSCWQRGPGATCEPQGSGSPGAGMEAQSL